MGTLLDRLLATKGWSSRVGLVVPRFLMVLALIRRSDLLAMLPGRCLPADAREAFHVFAPPIPVEGLPLHLARHMRRDSDMAVQHVAALLRSLLAA
jgi:DNA-binding transcriptional LysR family regulator